MKRNPLLVAAAAGAALLVPTAVSAGELTIGNMSATPNPVDVGNAVTVSNVNDSGSTCQDGEVSWLVDAPDLSIFDMGTASTDGSGNWSFMFTPTMPGEYIVHASCEAQPGAFPPIQYLAVSVFAQAPGTTTSIAPTTTAQGSTTTAAAAAVVTPAFTG
ncbi:MAG: hypothetical protein R2690_06725 [Acidimicrobiales bacterium]